MADFLPAGFPLLPDRMLLHEFVKVVVADVAGEVGGRRIGAVALRPRSNCWIVEVMI